MKIMDWVIGALVGAGIGWQFCTKAVAKLGYREHDEVYAALIGALVALIFVAVLRPYARTRSERRLVSPYGMTISVLAIFLWLIPMAMTGSFKSKFHSIPPVVRNQYRISCLFTHSSKSWHTVHYEVRKKGELIWEEGPLEGYFDLDIFGYRSKLNRIVLASRHKNKRKKVYGRNKIRLEEMAQFIGDRWEEINPEDPDVREVRFYRVGHRVGKVHCTSREHWSRPSLSSIPEKKRELIHSVKIGGSK
jgi:hypothetical protein